MGGFHGLNVQTSPAAISFYHAKHGAISLGASPFHVAVSQAIKNLGRMALPANAMHGKLQTWGNSYISGGGQQTAISRIIRGDGQVLPGEIENLQTAPDVIRKVFIVTSSLSRHDVAETLQAIRNGMSPSPHFVQLYWLLQTFFSACYEVGAFGYVVCQE